MKAEDLKPGDKFLHEGKTYEVGSISNNDWVPRVGVHQGWLFIKPSQENLVIHKDTEIQLID